MNIEKWQDIIGNVKDNFTVEDEGDEHIDDQGGVDVSFIVFEGPLGKMKLEYVSKPVVVNKKTTYSNRIGSETKVDYVYGDEKSHQLMAYKWDDDSEEWVQIEAGMFNQ